ncbi:glycosyltransferase [Sporosarcina sp. PTS2304]|uniref:glycosyltransferase n=1 Tax=Sporosarcina sp. PTS2304 TaxID=2283194 RepID=UPI000E0DB07B|nr:glycosyltransferase [Sporosarcina sp. PTS2304]AXH98442.1 glycosyltransferase [Sporosarcina sp. PTS2304]
MKASVLINNYNYGRFLKVCIESVIDQTYPDVEMIVYDDGSTDESISIMEEYKEQIQIIAHENHGKTPNINQMNAINKAFELSTGDVILLLDSDDFFMNNKIEEVVCIFTKDSTIEAIQHPLKTVDAEGKPTGVIEPILKYNENPIESIYATKNLFHHFSITSGLSFRRSFLKNVLPLVEDERTKLFSDTRLMLLAALDTKIATIFSPLAYYRRHGKNAWGSIGDPAVHKQYTEELYSFFNEVTKVRNKKPIYYSEELFLESTYFYDKVNLNTCREFITSDSNQDFWIWGAGEAGRSVLHALSEFKPSFKGFIDSDKNKQGTVVSGYPVYSPEEIVKRESMKLLISPYHAYETIAIHLKDLHIKEGLHFIYPYSK